MSKNVKMNVALGISEAMQRARDGAILQYHEWPDDKVMIYKNGQFLVCVGDHVMAAVLDNDNAEEVFSHVMTAEYCGQAWDVIQRMP